jgi:hypothetical protein
LERYFCLNSGVDEETASYQVDLLLSAWASARLRGGSQFGDSNVGSLWDAKPPPQPRVVDVTPEDLTHWLAGPDIQAQQIAAVAAKFGPEGPRELEEIIRLVRSARATRADADFRNPFAILGLRNSAAKMIFGDRLEFGALLNTQECRFLLDNWKDGYRFDEVCDVLDAACGSIETAGELLYT